MAPEQFQVSLSLEKKRKNQITKYIPLFPYSFSSSRCIHPTPSILQTPPHNTLRLRPRDRAYAPPPSRHAPTQRADRLRYRLHPFLAHGDGPLRARPCPLPFALPTGHEPGYVREADSSLGEVPVADRRGAREEFGEWE
jgi:hypothetical protein